MVQYRCPIYFKEAAMYLYNICAAMNPLEGISASGRNVLVLLTSEELEKGVDIPDNSSPDPLQELLNKEEDKITLIELADFLTPRQKQVMMMYYENRYTKAEIAEKLKIDEAAVRRHLKAAGHKILKKFS